MNSYLNINLGTHPSAYIFQQAYLNGVWPELPFLNRPTVSVEISDTYHLPAIENHAIYSEAVRYLASNIIIYLNNEIWTILTATKYIREGVSKHRIYVTLARTPGIEGFPIVLNADNTLNTIEFYKIGDQYEPRENKLLIGDGILADEIYEKVRLVYETWQPKLPLQIVKDFIENHRDDALRLYSKDLSSEDLNEIEKIAKEYLLDLEIV